MVYSVCTIVKQVWDMKTLILHICLSLPHCLSHLNMSSSVESIHYFVSQLFIDTIWFTVTDKISEGKIRYGCFSFFFFHFHGKRGLSLRKAKGGMWMKELWIVCIWLPARLIQFGVVLATNWKQFVNLQNCL